MINVGTYVSVPGGRVGKVVDIDHDAAFPYFVRFEFDGKAYEESDLNPVPNRRNPQVDRQGFSVI